MQRRTRITIGVAVAILIIVAIVYIAHRPGAGPTAAPQPAVKLATVQRGKFLVRVIAHGHVGPPPGSSAALAFPEAGKISSILARVGESVTAGQPLAQLDTTGFELAVAQAQGDRQAAAGSYDGSGASAAVRSAQAKLEVARTNLQRLQSGNAPAQSDLAAAIAAARQADLKVQADTQALQREKTLFAAGIAAAKDVQAAEIQLATDRADAQSAHVHEAAARAGTGGSLTQARADYATAQADLLAAEGQAQRANALLADAERNLTNATLRAPVNGVIVAIQKHPGESVDPTTPVIQLGAAEQHSATLSVPAAQALEIRTGDPVELTIGHSALPAHGVVIATVPAVDPATQQATVEVSGVPTTAVAGDAIDATIVVASHQGLLIPTSALVQDPQSGDTLVFVAKQDSGQLKFEPRKVEIAAGDQTTTQIRSGLNNGEQVAAEGAYELLAPSQTSE